MYDTSYVIVGNGIAGLSASKEIRKNDPSGKITIVSSEPYLTYYRLKLSKYLSKDFEDEDILVHDESWYEDNNIEVILRKIVEEIDVEKNIIKIDDGREIKYDKLLLANGSRPFIPPIPGKYKQGVLALRTLEDLKYIKKYFEKCEDITIVGGGLLGLEAAWSIKQLGKKVNIIDHSPFVLSKQLDEEISRKLEAKLINEGFNFYLDSGAEEILGEDVANGVKLNGNRIVNTDAVLISAGVRSNLDFIRDTPIEFNRGVKVDKHMVTNIDNIYAAGDVAEVEGKVLGLWTASNEQGKIAGQNMTGNMEEYISPKPYTKLEIGDIKLFSAGDVKDFDRVLEYKDDKKGIYHKLFATDENITGAILYGDISGMIKIKNAVVKNLKLEEYLKDGIKFE